MIALAGVVLVPQAVSAQDLNDFTFREFEGNYYLSRDGKGRSVLRVVETFTAEFPDYGRNKGVIRAIPRSYNGHPVSVKVESLKRNGASEPIYRSYTKNDQMVIEAGTDDHVRGNQTYELVYTLRDVIMDSGDYQELYWDTVGTDSPQPFGYVKGTVHLDPSVRDLFTGETLCYEGKQGSQATCQVTNSGDSVTFTSQGNIGPHENVTMLMKFKAGSFSPYRASLWARVVSIGVPFASLAAGLVGFVMAVRVRIARRRVEAKGRGTIVPEYLPPKDVSVLTASGIKGSPQLAIPAQLIDLAVRHNIRIIEKPGTWGKKKYTLELLSLDGLDDDERTVIKATTGETIGATYDMSKADYSVGASLRAALSRATGAGAIEKGYRHKLEGHIRTKGVAITLLSIGAFVPFILIFLLSAASGDGELSSELMRISTVPFVTWPFAFIGISLATGGRDPLTEKGAELEEYLKGLEMYMKVAEADRLKMLQSPEGANKTPINTDDKAQIVHLYERVLPYAVLFGLEKDWAKTLEIAYGDTAGPDWYRSSDGAFNAAMFSNALSNFSQTATSTFSPPSSSSSGSSGFSGGGFSGGGGGGGSFGGR